jgi:CBS domain-containing protein
MIETIRNVMTPNPVTVPSTVSIADAARAMREADVGTVIVLDGDQICGIVTDRDLVVRGLALGGDPAAPTLGKICSRKLTTVAPSDGVGEAVRLMQEKAIRRLPVVENGQVVGIVSIGDLARKLDRKSALGEISAAPPNR